MWSDNDVVRLCVPVAELKEPAPGSVAVCCERCSEPVWFDPAQAIIPGEHIGCWVCVFRALRSG